MAANTYKEKTSKAEKVKGEKKPFFKFDPAIFKDERTKLAFGIFLIAFSMAKILMDFIGAVSSLRNSSIVCN